MYPNQNNFYGYNQQNPYSYGAMPDSLAQMRGQTMPQAIPQNTQPFFTPQTEMNWVQGIAGAKAFLVAPGNSVPLFDSEGNSFYIKAVDKSGMPLPLRIFDYHERIEGEIASKTTQEQPTVDLNKFATVEALQALQSDFEALAARLEAMNGRTARRGKEVVENE